MADITVAVVSDTHVPSRAEGIPEWVKERVRNADHTIHAGDFDSEAAYETVEELSGGKLTAARGNADPLSLGLPEVATLEASDTTFVVTHGTGSREGYRERVAETAKGEVDGPAVGVSGHTHEVLNEDVAGVRLLNPGSATGATPADRATMMTVEIAQGAVRVELHEG